MIYFCRAGRVLMAVEGCSTMFFATSAVEQSHLLSLSERAFNVRCTSLLFAFAVESGQNERQRQTLWKKLMIVKRRRFLYVSVRIFSASLCFVRFLNSIIGVKSNEF